MFYSHQSRLTRVCSSTSTTIAPVFVDDGMYPTYCSPQPTCIPLHTSIIAPQSVHPDVCFQNSPPSCLCVLRDIWIDHWSIPKRWNVNQFSLSILISSRYLFGNVTIPIGQLLVGRTKQSKSCSFWRKYQRAANTTSLISFTQWPSRLVRSLILNPYVEAQGGNWSSANKLIQCWNLINVHLIEGRPHFHASCPKSYWQCDKIFNSIWPFSFGYHTYCRSYVM